MFLNGSIRLKKNPIKVMSRFLKLNAPWVYSNELEKVDTKIPPGSWVSLEGPSGHVLAYGHFNPHSLIAFRALTADQSVQDATDMHFLISKFTKK
jgi:23S rRNA G2069 N7-methylase RlmK/C1962 C5-methylase RlmI